MNRHAVLGLGFESPPSKGLLQELGRVAAAERAVSRQDEAKRVDLHRLS
jgi:hypothetical protein